MWFAALVGCGVEVFTFTLSDTFDTLVPGVDAPTDVDVMSLDELVDLEGVGLDALAEAGIRPGDLSHLKITELTFSLVDPAEGELDFVQAIEVWLSTDALGDVQIASEDPWPADATEIPIGLADVDLAPWLFDEGLQVSTFATGHPPVRDTLVRTTIAVEVGVTAQGAWSQLSGR